MTRATLQTLAVSRRQLLFSLSDRRIGVVVLRSVISGLLPHLLARFELLRCLALVNLVRPQSGFSQNRDPLGKHFDESPGHEKLLIARSAAMQPAPACAKLRQQRRGAVQSFEISRRRRKLH